MTNFINILLQTHSEIQMGKPAFDEYLGLIEHLFSFDFISLEEYYDSVLVQLKNEFCDSDFYSQTKSDLQNLNDTYRSDKQFTLLDFSKTLEIKTKKFSNMLEKCYRTDVLQNEEWKNLDSDWINDYAWITPLNCFERLKDVIRTRIFIRYLDGAKLVLDVLEKNAKRYNYHSIITYKSDEKGYYGIHYVVNFPINIQDYEWGTKQIMLNVEIQICTQISEVINELLHRYYEKQRLEAAGSDEDWQWNYDCDEFVPAYLGHMSHYIEGMIMQARKKSFKYSSIEFKKSKASLSSMGLSITNQGRTSLS